MNAVIKERFDPVKDFKEQWITEGIDREGVDYLENLGFYLCDKKDPNVNYPGRMAVTVSQIRNVFGEIKRIESSISEVVNDDQKLEFMLLRPKIAYNAARVIAKNRNSRIQAFKDVLEKAHSCVDESRALHIRNFTRFVESIVAYHKVYGGKE